MPSLFFICPNTRQQADTGILTDVDTLRDTWSIDAQCELPALRRSARGLGARDLHRRRDQERVGDRAKRVRAGGSPRLRGIVCRSDIGSWMPRTLTVAVR